MICQATLQRHRPEMFLRLTRLVTAGVRLARVLVRKCPLTRFPEIAGETEFIPLPSEES
jgi:hypothetical protein